MWLDKQGADAKGGTWVDPNLGRETVAALVAEWQASRLKVGPKTRLSEDSIVTAHILPEFGARRVASIEPDDVQQWVSKLDAERTPNTVHNVYAVLRLIMDFAVKRRRIAVTPCIGIELPRAHRRIEIKPLTHEQVRTLADAMSTDQARVAVLIAAYMGLRSGELWALKRQDFNPLRRELTVRAALKEVTARHTAKLPAGHERLTPSLVIGPTKTRTIRKLNMPGFLADELTALIPADAMPGDFIFKTTTGCPVRHGNFYRAVYLANLPADLKGTRWHDLRHTCATLLIDQGAHPLAVKQHLGHTDIRTTLNLYGHLFPAGQEALAASLDAGYRAAAELTSSKGLVALRP